ncbi:MAG TPA: FAD:protein FMN transferase [Candidatus Dormibacteraeota bacterium]|nr:FAD:protein FMN transferase [Candidatus Dormibacteraeota bacterium]
MSTIRDGTTRHVFTAFGGARCEVIVCAADDSAVSAVVADTYAFERRLTRFDARSELSGFNAASGARVAVSALLGELLRVCLDAYAMSDGMVNAACLPALIDAGYDRSIREVRRRPALPSRGSPSDAVPPLPNVLEVGEGWARLATGCAIDLGGVGKGWLADRLAERFENAVVNLGGDLRAQGHGPDAAGWVVSLCDGRLVTIRNAGVATSGTSGRRWPGGHHLIDTRTAAPADSDIQAVSVVAESALRAEILAKAACVTGSAAADAWLRARGSMCHAMQPASGARAA